MSFSFLWITDPWETLDHPKDTTLRLIQEAAAQGISQAWCDVKTLRLETGRVLLDAQPILSIEPTRQAQSVKWGPTQILSPEDFTSIQYRTDPPVDLAYLHPLQLLALALQKAPNTEIVNPIEVLLSQNEKMESAALEGLMAPTLVSSQWDRLLQFGKSEGRTVLKPLHEAQSHGIELLDWKTEEGLKKTQETLQTATSGFKTPVLLQKFLVGVSDGEVRLWFLDGELLTSLKKYPLAGDFRVNLDRGSSLAPHILTSQEKQKIPLISKHLRSKKIRLAALDLIEGFITDFNFTSPGVIVETEELLHENLARPIISALARQSNLGE